MSRYKMDDGTIVDTDKASQSWSEATRRDGRNYISVNTGSQWEHETLHLSRKGRYYIESYSQWQGSVPSAMFVSNEEAATWILHNGGDLPENLKEYVDSIEE